MLVKKFEAFDNDPLKEFEKFRFKDPTGWQTNFGDGMDAIKVADLTDMVHLVGFYQMDYQYTLMWGEGLEATVVASKAMLLELFNQMPLGKIEQKFEEEFGIVGYLEDPARNEYSEMQEEGQKLLENIILENTSKGKIMKGAEAEGYKDMGFFS